MIDAKVLHDTIYRLFNTDDGKVVLQHLIDSFVMKSQHSPQISAIDLAYNCGKADLVKEINSLVNLKEIK